MPALTIPVFVLAFAFPFQLSFCRLQASFSYLRIRIFAFWIRVSIPFIRFPVPEFVRRPGTGRAAFRRALFILFRAARTGRWVVAVPARVLSLPPQLSDR